MGTNDNCHADNGVKIIYSGTDLHKSYDNMSIYHHWWFTEYASEIAENLYEKEKLRPKFNHQSPQISYRAHLINLICLVAEEKSLSLTSVHVAIFLMDLFMDNHNIATERLNLVALVSLELGAKLEDRDAKVPKISELNAMINNQYPLKDYISVELMILEFFTFNIGFTTSAHFVEYFVFLVASETDYEELKSEKYVDYKHLLYTAHDTVFEILDISLKETEIVHSVPSVIASSIICAARMYLQFVSPWTPDLRLVTAYSLEDIEPYAKKLLRLRQGITNKRKVAPTYQLENVPEYTPKRVKESTIKPAKFLKPKPVE